MIRLEHVNAGRPRCPAWPGPGPGQAGPGPSALPAAFRRGDGRGEQGPDRGRQVTDEFLPRELR
jgi:hypothetical protein